MQAEHILKNSARRYSPANIGDSVKVYLNEVDRGRCEFPNILAVIIDITSDGMFKLGTKERILKYHYARNQSEVLPNKHLSLEQVDKSQERPLRTAANAQSQASEQGFTKCGCQKSCQANNCICYRGNVLCYSRCHGKQPNNNCLNHK